MAFKNSTKKRKKIIWLLRQNKVLTKCNLAKRGWQGSVNCHFCGEPETVDHLFVTCPYISLLWSWIGNYNNFHYNCRTISDLWLFDNWIPLKDSLLVELVRAATLWLVWLTRNRICFQHVPVPNVSSVGSAIIALTSYWCKARLNDSYFKLTLILPMDTTYLNQAGPLMIL